MTSLSSRRQNANDLLRNMDAIDICVSLAPVAPLNPAFSIFRCLCNAIQRVKWNKQQLRALAIGVAELLLALDRKIQTDHLVESQVSPLVHGLQMLIKEINSFVQSNESRSFLKLLFSKDERITAIDTYHRRLCSCGHAFQLSAMVDIRDWQKNNDDGRDTDRRLLNEHLTELESNQGKLRVVLDIHQHNMVAMMISLRKIVTKQLCGERERLFFLSTLSYLEEVSGKHCVDAESWMVTPFDVEFGPEIGSGGFGQMFEGVWSKTPVALKVLKTGCGATPSLAIIRRQIRTWSALHHPHILLFLGANVFDDRPFIVVPFLKNGNARDYLHDHPDCDRIMILHHISLGLAYLHDNNVMHGDLKAHNVLIDDSGHAVLCDFGLSHIKSDATARSVSQGITSIAGSRNWMSPERIMGGDLRKHVDIYAFGMTTFEILTGEVPLGHIAYADFIPLVVKLDVRPERPGDNQPFTVPDNLWSLVEACWAKAPQNRPTALMVRYAIGSFLSPNIAAHQFDMPPAYSSGSTVPKATPMGLLPDVSMSVSLSSASASPTNGIATPLSSSFSIPQSAGDSSSISGNPQNDDVGISEPSTSKRLRSPRPLPSPGGKVHFSRVKKVQNSNISTITERNPVSRPSESTPPTTAGYSHRVNTFVCRPLPDAASDRSTDNSGSWMPHPLQPFPATIEPSEHAGLIIAQESPNIGPRVVPSTQSSTSCEYSILGSEMMDATSSVNNGAVTSSPSLHNCHYTRPATTKDTLHPKTVCHRCTHNNAPSRNTPANEQSGTGKPKGLRRVTNWLQSRLPGTQGRSPSHVQESSGFRIVIPGRPIPRSEDPSAEMWSQDELLERWITRSSDIIRDEEFQDLFLETYTAFTYCSEVFDGLRLRFDAAATGYQAAKTRAFRRQSIISALKYWITSPYMPTDPGVLVHMKEFVNSVSSSSFMVEQAKQIAEVIDEKKEEYTLPSIPESVTTVKALLDNTSEQIATVLTFLEGIMFSRIRPADYINCVREHQGDNRVADANMTTHKITYWVKQKVLRSDQIKPRGKAFKFFIKTAQNCYDMRNFSSTAAIVMALESEVIQCLPETIAELDSQDKMLLAKLSSSVKTERAYRTALESSPDYCIPRLEFHLKNLKALLPGCLPRIMQDSTVWINLMGCIALAAQMRDITQFKMPVTKKAPEAERLGYVLKQLATIEINTVANNQLRQRSRLVRASELKFHKARVRGLEISGFDA